MLRVAAEHSSDAESQGVVIRAPPSIASQARKIERMYAHKTCSAEGESRGWECPQCQRGRLTDMMKAAIIEHMKHRCA